MAEHDDDTGRSNLQLRPAMGFDLAFLADLFSRGFEGYFVPIAESPEGLAARLRYDSIDLALSRVALLDERAAGILFVAVRGWQCRIAGMGVVTDARRQAVGRRLMEEAITRCREAGLREMVLEVIEQNEPAVALYRDLGFETERRLVGFEPGQSMADPRPRAGAVGTGVLRRARLRSLVAHPDRDALRLVLSVDRLDG